MAAGALVGISLLAIVNSLDTVAQRPLLLASLTTLRGLLYLPAAAAVWLGFFPPRWWTARFAAEASNEPPGGRSNASEGA